MSEEPLAPAGRYRRRRSCRRSRSSPGAAPGGRLYDAVIDRVFAEVLRRNAELTSERQEAPGLLAALERMPPGRRRLVIRNSRRFQGWALCQLLIARSHALGFDDPAAGWQLAELAAEVAERLDRELYGREAVYDLQCAAWAQLGNALRIRGDLHRAEEAFGIAGHLLDRGSGDPLERARLLDLLSSLRRAQRRLEESAALLEEALELYREVDDRSRVAGALIKQAIVNDLMGDPETAIRRTEEALALLDPSAEPRVVVAARHNLMEWLASCGRHREAWQMLPETRRLHSRLGDAMWLLRLRWAEGKLAAGLGRSDEAEKALLEAQEGFLARGIGYTAAVVALDLAALYAAEGRRAEVKELAAAMVPIFRSQDVHREATAALLFFHQAARADRASRGLIEELRAYLRAAGENPRLRFVPGRG